jgi:hypothetical protein
VSEVRRKVYFAFDFDDLMRVNNVRQTGKIGPRDMKQQRGFYDRSIWESRAIRNVEGLKSLMRDAVKHSSVICALVGTNTWQSRWAKYEIARSVVDDRGLFAIHINSINHTVRKAPDALGINPLHVMGIYRDARGSYYLVERHPVVKNATTAEMGWEWQWYSDFTEQVTLPRYIPAFDVGKIAPLSLYTAEYDFIAGVGSRNIGKWIDDAAVAVGR